MPWGRKTRIQTNHIQEEPEVCCYVAIFYVPRSNIAKMITRASVRRSGDRWLESGEGRPSNVSRFPLELLPLSAGTVNVFELVVPWQKYGGRKDRWSGEHGHAKRANLACLSCECVCLA